MPLQKKDQFGERSERSEDLRPRRVNLLARPPVVPQSCGCSWQFGLRLRRAGISIQEVISMCIFTLGQGFKQQNYHHIIKLPSKPFQPPKSPEISIKKLELLFNLKIFLKTSLKLLYLTTLKLLHTTTLNLLQSSKSPKISTRTTVQLEILPHTVHNSLSDRISSMLS